jgi:hypothetical protein
MRPPTEARLGILTLEAGLRRMLCLAEPGRFVVVIIKQVFLNPTVVIR